MLRFLNLAGRVCGYACAVQWNAAQVTGTTGYAAFLNAS